MADPTADDTTTPYVPRCPWCSAELPDPAAKTCPSCHANLAGEGETQVPGLTALDLERLAFRRSTTPKKSRLLSWISGDSDYEDATDPVAAPGSLDLPPLEVRREMLRLEMDALIADLTAEAGALAADDADAHGTDPVAAAAALQAEIDAVRRAELVHAQLGLGDDVSVVDPDAPAPEPETLTAVVATNGVNAPDELRGVTDRAPVEVVPAPAADDAPEVTPGADEPVPPPAAPAARGRRFRRSR